MPSSPAVTTSDASALSFCPALNFRTGGGFEDSPASRSDAAAQALLNDAKAHDEAGAALILMECVPAALAKQVTESVNSPTIGIGAGVDCDGQVLVMHDMLGVFPGKTAKFVKNFMQGQTSIQAAVKAYVDAVKDRSFPAAEHTFSA